MLEVLKNLWETSGFAQFFITQEGWKNGVMILISFVLLYLAIKKQFEPLLLLPIAFGMLLTNLPWPGGGIFHPEWFQGRFVRSIPKAMGSRRSGSNCFLIAMYKRTNERRIITPFFQPSCVMKNWAKPEVSHRFFNTSNIYNSSTVTYEIVTRGVPVSTEAPLEVRT